MKTMTTRQWRLLAVLTFMLLMPSTGVRAAARINLMVDNSGSMYGQCQQQKCEDVMPEVRRALGVVLGLLDAYNRHQPPERRTELLLTVFGGLYQGQEEFKEIPLSGELSQDLQLLERELSPANGFYKNTKFSVGFRRALEILTRQGQADCTIFLTDAVDGGSLEDLDFTALGRTYLYSMMPDTDKLDLWAERINSAGGAASVSYLEHGWEICSSFVKVFLMLLQPENDSCFFSHYDQEASAEGMALRLDKLSQNAATYYLVFHGSETPDLQGVEFEGAPLQTDAFTVGRGPNILTISLPAGSQAGSYEALLGAMPNKPRISVFSTEAVKLLLLDRQHYQEPVVRYKRNAEIELTFGFAVHEGGSYRFLSPEQQAAFQQYVHVAYEVREEKGDDMLQQSTNDQLSVVHTFSPDFAGESRYTITSGWSYLDPNPPPTSQAGSFLLASEVAPELHLEFGSDQEEFWQGRRITVTADWLQSADPLPAAYQDLPQIIIRDTGSQQEYVLKAEAKGNGYHADLGTTLLSGLHVFELVAPVATGLPGVSLTGRELTIAGRRLWLDLDEISFRSQENQTGVWGRLVSGWQYLLGKAQKKSVSERLRLDAFPYDREIKLPYFDATEQVVTLSAAIEPQFADETFEVAAERLGLPAYTASKARLPGFMGLFRSDPQELQDALAVEWSPEGALTDLDKAPLRITLSKRQCDWQLDTPLTPKPGVRYSFALLGPDGDRVALPPATVNFEITTQNWDQEIVTTLRLSAFIAFGVLVGLLLFAILALLIWLRAHAMQRQELWEEILSLVPEDFCLAERFPDKAYQICRAEILPHSSFTPADIFSRMIQEKNEKLLRRVYTSLKLSELRALRERCQKANFDSTWEFPFSGGTTVTIYGSELAASRSAVRLRDQDGELPQVIGSLSVRGTDEEEQTILFAPKGYTVFRYKGEIYIPPHRHGLLLRSGDSIAVGLQRNELRVEIAVSQRGDALHVQCRSL